MKSASILGLGSTAVDKDWLNKMFEEAGLDPGRARQAARVVLERILRRDQGSIPPGRPANLKAALIKDPMVSFNRIIGRGDGGLPFVDAEEGGLSRSASPARSPTPASTRPWRPPMPRWWPRPTGPRISTGRSGRPGPERHASDGGAGPAGLDSAPVGVPGSEGAGVRSATDRSRSIFSVTSDSEAQPGHDPLDAGPPKRPSAGSRWPRAHRRRRRRRSGPRARGLPSGGARSSPRSEVRGGGLVRRRPRVRRQTGIRRGAQRLRA